MNKYTGVIFDLDGVIVDTAKYHYLAWKSLAEELGFKFLPQQNEKLKGVSRMHSLDILLDIGGLTFEHNKKIELADKKNNAYKQYLSNIDESEVLPCAIELLKYLRKNKICIALGSASKNAPLIIEKTGLQKYFDVICDGNCNVKPKPSPELFLLAANKMNLKSENCVVFEDAESGISAAKSAGMYAIGVGNNSTLNQADIVIKNLCHLKPESLF